MGGWWPRRTEIDKVPMANSHDCCSTTYADHPWRGTVEIGENVRIASDTYRVEFDCPEIARRVVPGQFVMLRLPKTDDPLLGRPLAVYDVATDHQGQPQGLKIVYLVVGKMTGRLAELTPGTRLEVWGPLGNGFPVRPTEHLVMVAGGIGQTPMLTLGRECLGKQPFGEPPREVTPARRVTLCYGGRHAERLAGVDDFQRSGIEVRLSTDDGSAGHHGLVTDLIGPVVEQSPEPCRIACCGPEPLLEATARIAAELKIPCHVSLESPMACGIGICFSCVTKIREKHGNNRGGGDTSSDAWDYRRTCVDGPVFNAEDVVF